MIAATNPSDSPLTSAIPIDDASRQPLPTSPAVGRERVTPQCVQLPLFTATHDSPPPCRIKRTSHGGRKRPGR